MLAQPKPGTDYNAESTFIDPSLNQLIWDLSMLTVQLARQQATKNLRTVKEFADKLWTIIELSFGQFSRRDVVTDNYFDPHPLKDHARTERGSGTTSVDISLDSPLPKNFTTDFMLNTANKAALYINC